MSEEIQQEPTVRLDLMPSREDLFAVMQAATWPCRCPPLTSRLMALSLADYAARRCCKGCRARLALSNLARISEAL